jgi:hypothetical protein
VGTGSVVGKGAGMGGGIKVGMAVAESDSGNGSGRYRGIDGASCGRSWLVSGYGSWSRF